MKHLAWHEGIEICRTEAGHLVVLDPRDSEADRAELVRLLGDAYSLDALIFPSIADAKDTIDDFVKHGLVH
jgi:hypothetical protein